MLDGKTLVGFVLAATDGSMVATVDLVFVAEAYRGRALPDTYWVIPLNTPRTLRLG